jgi:hypothetical protein
MEMKNNKKANTIVTLVLVLIILTALVFVILLYFDIDENDIKGKYYGIPNYDFNERSIVFIEETTFNKMKYAYNNVDDMEKLCLFGLKKNNGDVLINNIREPTGSKVCVGEDVLGYLYINKVHNNEIYDINCGLDESQIDNLEISKNIMTGIMCKDTWFGFYNNKSLEKSYKYQIVT